MRVFIVEDNADMRFILKRILKKNFPQIEAIGESDSAEEALIEIPNFKPKLVLVDISLPGMDGIELIRRLKPASPALCVLVVTGHELDIYKQSALQAGAIDIISKTDYDLLLKCVAKLLEKLD